MQSQHHTKYKFRAECATDAHVIRAVLFPWFHDWSERRENIEYEGVEYPAPDVDVNVNVNVEFSVVSAGPSLNEIRWPLDGIDNCHVAAESIERVEDYTGDRVSQQAFAMPAELPRAGALGQAITAARVRFQVLQLEIERVQNLIGTCRLAYRQGAKWNAPSADAQSSDWLTAVGGPVEGLTAIRRIAAPLGCKKSQSKGDAIVKARIATIGA